LQLIELLQTLLWLESHRTEWSLIVIREGIGRRGSFYHSLYDSFLNPTEEDRKEEMLVLEEIVQ
jgi:hypothetical protein